MLQITNLHVSIDDKQILKGLNLTIKAGEIHALLGPNGCGKSSLALTLAGHSEYKIQNPQLRISLRSSYAGQAKSKIQINKKNIINLSADERAKSGLFLAFQNPVALDGIGILPFLRTIYKNLYPEDDMALFEFRNLVEKEARLLGLNSDLLNRNVNDGFSGGERKRLEMLQLRLLRPKFAIIDEIDSGLDVDGLKSVALAIAKSVKEDVMGCLVITHHQKLLKYLKPDVVHVMIEEKIVATGKSELLEEIENKGYEKFKI